MSEKEQNKVLSYFKSLMPRRENQGGQLFTTQKLVTLAILVALHVIIARIASIKIGPSIVITVSGITEVVAGLLFGPLSGGITGLLGSFLNQLITYGFTATTVLWILPAAVKGWMCGVYAKAYDYQLKPFQILWILAVSALVVTTMNTVVQIIDAEIFQYSTKATQVAIMVTRYINGALTSVVYMIVTTPLLHRLNKLPGIKKMRE